MARNKEFDEKLALIKAMELFWEQGYEKHPCKTWWTIWGFTAEVSMILLVTNILYL